MSLRAYEDACARAELFGQPIPDKEDFLSKNKHLDVVEFEDVDIKTAEKTAMLNDDIKEASGGLSELNTILNSTQSKLNKLKGVCGTFTNFFRIKLNSKDSLSYSTDPSYVGHPNLDKTNVPTSSYDATGSVNEGLGQTDKEMTPRAGKSKLNETDINTALNDLDTMQKIENTSVVSKAAAKDMSQQIGSQTSKLDNLINQADRALGSMQHQNKQMRSFLR